MSRNLKNYTKRALLLAASYVSLGYTKAFYATNNKSSREVYDLEKAERLSPAAALDLAAAHIRKYSHLSYNEYFDIADGAYEALEEVIDGSVYSFWQDRTKSQVIRNFRKAAKVAEAA